MYEQLLKLEDYELHKGSSFSWKRLLEIRHLKDRMIRKCQRLAKGPLSRSPGVAVGLSFQTIVAPSDFRLREMERWFLDQHARTQQKRHEKGSSTPCKCSKCPESLANLEVSLQVNKFESSTMASQTNHSPQSKVELDQGPGCPCRPTVVPSSIEKPALLTYRNRSTTTATPPSPRRVTYLDTGFDRSDHLQRTASLPTNGSSHSEPEPIKPTALDPISNHQVRRRPSCLKRSSVSKRVSWADNLDAQASKYVSVVRDAQTSGVNQVEFSLQEGPFIIPTGLKWEEIRDTYMEQMLGLEALHQRVEESLKHLRSESEQLKRADETIRRQREVLSATFKEFEQKQIRFQAKGEVWLLDKVGVINLVLKVQEALNDADHVISIAASNKEVATT